MIILSCTLPEATEVLTRDRPNQKWAVRDDGEKVWVEFWGDAQPMTKQEIESEAVALRAQLQ